MNQKKIYKILIFIICLMCIVLLTFADRHISPHPSLVLFYMIPVFLATWFSGFVAGVIVAVSCVLAWLSIDFQIVTSLYVKPDFFYINTAFKLIFLIIFVFIIAKLKSSMMHEKEMMNKIRSQNKELQEFDKRKSDFVANVAHELKNPLGIIKLVLENILDSKSSKQTADQEEFVLIKRNTERMIRLVTDLLDIAKIEAGEIKLAIERFDAIQLIEDIIKDYNIELTQKNIIVEKYFDEGNRLLEADKDKFSEVVINLLSNAIKYTPEGGKIMIKFFAVREGKRFEISDTGPGLNREDRLLIFDKFKRITSEKKEGTGLGLPIAKNLIELHKGKIWVESELGKGSKFVFILPC